MKKIQWMLLVLLTVLSVSFVACGGDDDPTSPTPSPTPTPTPAVAKIDIPATENTKPVFGTEGGVATVKFTASQAWTASAANTRADEWLSVTPTSGMAGTYTLTITSKANDTYDERGGSITIKSGTASQTIVVTQKQKDALLVTRDKVEIDSEGGEINVEVNANIEFSVSTDEDWITQANTRAMQSSNLEFYVSENEETTKREGHITISSGEFSETVTIYQAASVPTIIISQNVYSMGAEGGDITVEVKSNVSVSVTLPKGGWISESSTRSMSTNTYVFTVSKNEGYDARSGDILFTNKENGLSEKVTVTQMQLDAIIIAKNKYELDAKGGTLSFDVQSNIDYSVSVDADWITETRTRALQTEKLSFSVASNETYEDRTATIAIEGAKIKQSISVIQHGLIAVTGIELDKTTIEINVGSTSKLTATVLPSDAANKEVKWSSSNTSIATVDAEGNIKAIAIGKATITATSFDGNVSTVCEVIVKEIENIIFADTKVKEICVEHWDKNGDGELNYEEAANILSIGSYFKGTDIISFDELQYFVNLEDIYMAFNGCINLKSIILPNNLTTIGYNAFGGCSNLEYLYLPNSLAEIGDYAISGCKNLKSLDLPSNLSKIGQNAFNGCGISSITIPKAMTRIDDLAFFYCQIESVVFHEDVTSIGKSAFDYCVNLEKIDIPENVTIIESQAFNHCNNLISVNLPNNLLSIEYNAFSGCQFKSIDLPNGLKSIGDGAFSNNRRLSSINIPESVSTIEGNAFAYCTNLEEITLTDNITYIGPGAFHECKKLTGIVLPKKITIIEGYLFWNAYNLQSIVIPNNVTCIGNNAFYSCSTLREVSFSQNVSEIKSQAFSGCYSLKEITIPKSVETIGSEAFMRCSGLNKIICESITVPKLSYDVFEDTNNAPIYVPASSLEAYKTAEGWSDYADRIQAIHE